MYVQIPPGFIACSGNMPRLTYFSMQSTGANMEKQEINAAARFPNDSIPIQSRLPLPCHTRRRRDAAMAVAPVPLAAD